jgi:membrane-associated phospholipid phosphatase
MVELVSRFRRRLHLLQVCVWASWDVVDRIVAAYAIYVGLVAAIWAPAIPAWPQILAAHGVLLGFLWWLPARGSAWERPRSEPVWRFAVRTSARFLRYTWPALLLTPFFEEVALTVNAASPSAPYWFERYLFAADRALFGASPAITLSQAGTPLVDEVMHAFYFAYYPLVTGGIILAWRGGSRNGGLPAPGFDTAMTCMMLGFFLSFVWYPFLPARGPWEHAEVVGSLRPFSGWVFTPLIDVIIAGAAVSGGCFPSAHVSGSWALTFGLYDSHWTASRWMGVVATGLSVACVYTRYHHAVDVLAGLIVAAIAALLGHWLTRPPART